MQDRGASRAGAHGKEVAQLRLPTGTRGKGHKQTPQRESQERLRLHKRQRGGGHGAGSWEGLGRRAPIQRSAGKQWD